VGHSLKNRYETPRKVTKRREVLFPCQTQNSSKDPSKLEPVVFVGSGEAIIQSVILENPVESEFGPARRCATLHFAICSD
jgi:hypothetical protein